MQNLTNQPIRTLVLDSAVDNAEVIGNLLRAEPGFTVATSSVVYGEGARTARQVETGHHRPRRRLPCRHRRGARD